MAESDSDSDIEIMAQQVPCNCLAAADESGRMIRHKIFRRALGPKDIHISVTYSGICHSDIHSAKGEWGAQAYPYCVGHEILGRVKAVGSGVSKFKVGEPIGVGCFTDSCRICEECGEGNEQYCSGPGGTCGTYGEKAPESLHPGGISQGGYASDFVVDENYAIRIPEKMDVAAAAPLLCAGITCFSPFIEHGLKAGQTLGVVGLGGLGHMAVKIGKAMGCEAIVFSRSSSKTEDALRLGAAKVVISTDAEAMKAHARSCHFIYNSIAFDHDVQPYLNVLRTRGTMIMVGGVPKGAMPGGTFAIIPRGLKIAGSCIGGIRETQQMIDFCAEHNILSDIELIPATPEDVDKAWARAINSDVKFRFVIDTAKTLTAPDAA
ncbi:unnamed protein product [Polarella glacialis]|uniref:Enoyl reductase (ER) domain-containing protein n=1 Tax=Polarella glacialis TaxID=89957 RepID=A0A813GEB0_POLGL|nr:unnamed protein product [Polarella glacialis]